MKLGQRFSSFKDLENTTQNAYRMLPEDGHVMLLLYSQKEVASLQSRNECVATKDGEVPPNSLISYDAEINNALDTAGLEGILRIPVDPFSGVASAVLATKRGKHATTGIPRAIHLLHFAPLTEPGSRLVDGLREFGWDVHTDSHPFTAVEYEGIVLILDDLTSPIFSNIEKQQWVTLQALFGSSRNKVLWLTQGSQHEVTEPDKAQIHGLLRTIRDEDPSMNLATLDVEHSVGRNTVLATHSILERLQVSKVKKTQDYEFVERGGTIYVSRILPDVTLNLFCEDEREGAKLVERPFYSTTSQIRLCCEQVGNLDSLKFHEVDSKELCLKDDEVEVEIAAAGLNFKDIAISSGLIPGNERLLGFEGGGIIRRTSSGAFRTGDRVLFTKPGAFANRTVVESGLVHKIPNDLSFEKAATLGAVYPVAMYSLFDLGNIRKGDRVLVHSAAGGLGIACVQLCQYMEAEVFATVGNDEKRRYLIDTLSVPSNNIFNSRTTTFAAELMQATHGEGVDIIINSLTGDLLEESWRCISAGGTMVELGKRDILERNYLPMEPFSRNASYRSFDISAKSVPSSVMSRYATVNL